MTMTDPKKKREPRELPVGEAIEKLTELQRWYDSGLEVALANARAKYTEEHTDKMERILSRVHPDARELVRAKATLPDTRAVNETESARAARGRT